VLVNEIFMDFTILHPSRDRIQTLCSGAACVGLGKQDSAEGFSRRSESRAISRSKGFSY